MKDERLRVALLFGGRSTEHEVSVVSAQGVLAAIDRESFVPAPIGITRSGAWLTTEETLAALSGIGPGQYSPLPDVEGEGLLSRHQVLATLRQMDVVFPLVHGTYGEDGTLQGLLELAGVPYVGAGVTASALGMDKAMQKPLYRQEGLPVPDWVTVALGRWRQAPEDVIQEIEAAVGYPCFIKPANGGSSIGTSKVRQRGELDAALATAFRYDRKALAEVAILGRQVEVAVLGNDEPQASAVGEVTFSRDFYDYIAKYEDPDTKLHIPADIQAPTAEQARKLAVRAFKAIDCAGYARVDLFVTAEGRLYINEINTIPGFTPNSMYPKLWEATGLSYRDLITRLIELALERWRERRGV